MAFGEIHFEVYINSVWEDITKDVVESQPGSYGIRGNSQLDRVASTGSLEIVLRNDSGCLGGVAGYYSPYASGSKTGWRIGLPFRLKIIYEGMTYIKFYGYIADIQPDSGTYGKQRVNLIINDWMEYAAKYPITLANIEYDKKINEIVPVILSGMPVQPQNTSFNTGQATFSTVFDTVRENTKALSEFAKLANSELGYIYLKKDKEFGETLVVEGRYTRSENNELTSVTTTKLRVNSGNLLTEEGTYLLLEDGGKIILDEVEVISFFFDNNMTGLETSFGSNLANRVSVKSYPRYVDTSNQVLFSLNNPISLSPGETKTIRGTYKDPNGGARVSAKSVETPVSGTDYQMWSNSNGTGTNLTANLTVTALSGVSDIEYTLKNTGGTSGYVTLLQARGLGIYLYDPVEYVTQDTDSINTFSYAPLTLDMKYQDDPYTAASVADVILEQDKEPRQILNKVNFLANYDDFLMKAFLHADIGDLIRVRETQTGIDGYYHIHGVDFEILQGGVIYFSWIVKEAISFNTDFWVLGTSTLGESTILGY